MFKTSYFGNTRKLLEASYNSYTILSIARYKPRWFKGPEYLRLAPSEKLLKGYKDSSISIEQYRVLYRSYLDSLDIETIKKELSYVNEKLNIVFCCYEGKDVFCHRMIVAEWLRDNGYECEEL